MVIILKLIGMIVLGILSAILSYYNKNYYVRVFNDILGREEDESPAARVGRGFYYGFLFPIYFVLVLTGLVALIAFLIVGGIIAGIVFVLVWATEKFLPQEPLGAGIITVFSKLGLSPPPVAAPPEQAMVPPSEPPAPAPPEQASAEAPPEQPGASDTPKE